MSSNILDISRPKAAKIAGYGLLIMTIVFIFADTFAFRSLIVPGDAATTAKNIIANEILFRLAISGFIIVAILDVLVAWALYVLLKPVNKSLSLLAAWFRLVYSTMLGTALFNLAIILILISGANYLAVFQAEQLNAQALLLLNAFDNVWAIGLIFFGCHLLILGYVIIKADYIPKTLGILLMIAGFSYLVDYFSKIIFPNFDLAISMIMGWGELIFMFWLLFKGVKIPEAEVSS